MKTLLWLLLLLPAQVSKSVIPWNQHRRLTWADFQARPDEASSNAALTSAAISFNFGYSERSLKFSISCVFDKKSSWGRIKNIYILGHEQGHFDIAELYARKLNKALSNYKFRPKTVNKDFNGIYQRMMQEHSNVQQQYDHETDYSRDPEEQLRWLKKIDAGLEEYSAWADYTKEHQNNP